MRLIVLLLLLVAPLAAQGDDLVAQLAAEKKAHARDVAILRYEIAIRDLKAVGCAVVTGSVRCEP